MPASGLRQLVSIGQGDGNISHTECCGGVGTSAVLAWGGVLGASMACSQDIGPAVQASEYEYSEGCIFYNRQHYV